MINEIINAYARAAKRAKTAGFDGIQILAAHGFLLSQFLCPRYNDRADAYGGNIDPEKNKAYFRDEAKTFKQKIKVPLILVGGIRSYTVAEKLINDGTADYISMSRPFIREPDLVNRWQSGKLSNAACISCNNCIEPAKAGKGISCVPIEAIPEITFFPQEVRRIPAGFPHKKGSSYLITKGLDQRDAMFIPMIKVELEYEGVISQKSLSFPLNGDDYEKVNMTISELLGKIP